jgi:hypothetical protein
MKLFDRLRKPKFREVATAIPAIPAIREAKALETTSENSQIARIALAKLDLLKQFRFDDVQADIADGYPAEELSRINNMAWEFIEADGMPFDQAIKAAAEIVTTCAAADCEKAYTDVMQLWERLKQGHPEKRSA